MDTENIEFRYKLTFLTNLDSSFVSKFSKYPNLLKRDTYPSAKLLKNIEMGAICCYKIKTDAFLQRYMFRKL